LTHLGLGLWALGQEADHLQDSHSESLIPYGEVARELGSKPEIIQMLKKRLAELQREEAVRRHELASMRDKGKSKAEEIDLGQAMEECRAHIKALDLSQQSFNKQVEERKADMEALLKAAQRAAAKADAAVASTNEALKYVHCSPTSGCV
jgi:hypothetical protein